MMDQWRKQYAAYIQRRFNTNSRGGGDWPALALSTVQRRRKGKKPDKKRSSLARDTQGTGQLVQAGGTFSILRDTSRLFNQLSPGIEKMGNIGKASNVYVATVTFGGEQKYPDGGPTVADIMSFHQKGGKSLPRRKILVDPDDKTKKTMARTAIRLIKEL